MNHTQIPETGDKCKLCGKGRVALVYATIEEGEIDDEPYTNGVREGNNEPVTFEDFITLVIYACDHCGHTYVIYVE